MKGPVIMKEVESFSVWDDEVFQDKLVALLTYDAAALKLCGSLLTAEDFRPIGGAHNGRARWIVAERMLEHYQKHHEPIGTLIRADVLEYARQLNLSELQVKELSDYVKLSSKIQLTAPDSITSKAVRYKSARLMASSVSELNDLLNSNQLTEEAWQEVSKKALAGTQNGNSVIDYGETLDDRIARRRLEAKKTRIPWTYIDPLDSMVRCVGPKQLGLILAPYKRGKSTMLLWLAFALTLQRYNVLFVSLEDSRTIVEDRLDSIITHIPSRGLNEYPVTVAKRFARWRSMVTAKLRIYDGTEERVTMSRLEQVILDERNQGFIPTALIVDYDEKIVGGGRYKEKRFETDETYSELTRVVSRYNLVGWTAAQTQRDTKHLKILSGDKVAEDIGKIKKVTCAIGMGKGEWTEESIYLWVAAHKNDRQEVGTEIVPDLARHVIYDSDATRREQRAHDPGLV